MADISSITLPGGGTYDLKDKNAQPKIAANGILKGDGQGGVSAATAGTDYQAPLTFDATPTENSTNPVQSGGVYTDVRTRVPNIGKGTNLFRNPWFRVNQRGITSLNLPSASGYTCDGWVIYRSSFVQNADNSVTITVGSSSYGFIQVLPLYIIKPGEKYTLSVRSTTETSYITFTMPSSSDYIGYLSSGVRIWVGVYPNRYEFWFTQSAGFSFTLTKVKLELGEESTLDGDVEPDYEYELYRCMTSTADSSDTYANKSLATEQQLAYVESGTTASQNYTAGQYICWNGLLYTADTAIASGATFYTSGGNKNLSECVGGGFNDLIRSETIPLSIADTAHISNISNCQCIRIGRVCILSLACQISTTGTGWGYLINVGIVPKMQVTFSAFTSEGNRFSFAISDAGGNGVIAKAENKPIQGGYYVGSVVFPV